MSLRLGHTIRQARKDRGWSLKTFSEKIGISIMTLQRIETGQVSPSIKLMVEIADTLGRPITDFIMDKDRTLIRLKSSRIKSWENGKVNEVAIFPKDVIEENLGINLVEIKPGGKRGVAPGRQLQRFLTCCRETPPWSSRTSEWNSTRVDAVYFDARHKHRLVSDRGGQVVMIYRR